jgi:hypothetical protein
MAFVVNDRVQEFTSTTGTGTLTLTGSPDGFETFSSAVGNGNTTYYTISSNTTEFEVGIGTVGAGTLSRDTVISSSNSDALVNFSAGTKNVFVTLPASKTILLNDSGTVDLTGNLDLNSNDITGTGNINITGNLTASGNLTSLGIDDNATSTAITINSSEQVEFTAGTALLPAITTTGDTNTGMWFPAADTIAFSEGGAEAMRIDSSGRVGIGTSSPSSLLHIYSSSPQMIIQDSGTHGTDSTPGLVFKDTSSSQGEIGFENSGEMFIRQLKNSSMTFRTNNTERMRIHSSGTISFLTTSSSVGQGDTGICILTDGELLTARNVGGASTVTKFNGSTGRFQTMGDGDAENTNNSYGGLSDRTLKENEVDANSQWNDIKSLQIKNYNLIEYPDRTQLGVIAQDLEASGMNGLVKTDDQGIKSVKYSVLYMKAVKALQEAIEKIETLEAKVQTLENNQS